MPRIPLLGAAYEAQSVIADAQRCINLYPEANPRDSPVPLTHYQTPGLRLLGTAALGPSPPTGITTWNPLDKSVNIALSNGNLTATSTGATGTVRATTSKSSGKFGFHVQHQLSNNIVDSVGIAGPTAALEQYLGFDAFGWGLRPNGALIHNGSVLTTLSSYALGDIVTVVVDADAALAWWQVNNGLWNNSATANPTTGLGGISVPGVSTYWPACDVSEVAGSSQPTKVALVARETLMTVDPIIKTKVAATVREALLSRSTEAEKVALIVRESLLNP